MYGRSGKIAFMTFAYWSILLAFLIPYFSIIYAKTGKGFSNKTPRVYLSELEEGPRKRAYWAHQNAFEILPLYFSAIILGHIQNIDLAQLNTIAGQFLAFRVAYVFAYIFDRSTLRSILWSGSFGCILGIFLLAI